MEHLEQYIGEIAWGIVCLKFYIGYYIFIEIRLGSRELLFLLRKFTWAFNFVWLNGLPNFYTILFAKVEIKDEKRKDYLLLWI